MKVEYYGGHLKNLKGSISDEIYGFIRFDPILQNEKQKRKREI